MLSFQPWHACFFTCLFRVYLDSPWKPWPPGTSQLLPLGSAVYRHRPGTAGGDVNPWSAVNGMGCWEVYMGLYGMNGYLKRKTHVRNNAYKWILKHHAFDFWEQIVDILKATMWLQMVLLIFEHDIITEISPDNILGCAIYPLWSFTS